MKRRRSLLLLLAVLVGVLCIPGLAAAQQLPQEARWALEDSFRRIQNSDLVTTRDQLEELVDPDDLRTFLDEAVLRLTFHPDGRYEVFTRPGGNLLSFALGKEKVEPMDDATEDGGWLRTTGEYSPPKRPRPLSLTVRASEREVTIDCHNKFKQAKQPVTYYVGPLKGLFCMGLVDEVAGGLGEG